VLLMRPQNWPRFSFGPWLSNAAPRMRRNKMATALANKLARIAWSVLNTGKDFDTPGLEIEAGLTKRLSEFRFAPEVAATPVRYRIHDSLLRATFHSENASCLFNDYIRMSFRKSFSASRPALPREGLSTGSEKLFLSRGEGALSAWISKSTKGRIQGGIACKS
jgi:hypothetical protein